MRRFLAFRHGCASPDMLMRPALCTDLDAGLKETSDGQIDGDWGHEADPTPVAIQTAMSSILRLSEKIRGSWLLLAQSKGKRRGVDWAPWEASRRVMLLRPQGRCAGALRRDAAGRAGSSPQSTGSRTPLERPRGAARCSARQLDGSAHCFCGSRIAAEKSGVRWPDRTA